MRNPTVAIIDYEMGNLFSVRHACEHVGLTPIIASDKSTLIKSDAMILPGVGAFGDAIKNLERLGLVSLIKDFIGTGKPFLGICLGMQILMTESEEFGMHKGLDIINGRVAKLPNVSSSGEKIKVPHIGWNNIYTSSSSEEMQFPNNSLLKDIYINEFMYFVHSYYCIPDDKDVVLSTTTYAETSFCSGIGWNNVYAFQFHPEKSGLIGLKIYENFAKTIPGYCHTS